MSNVQILLGDKIVTLNDLASLLENMVLKKGDVFKCKGCEYTHNQRSSLKYHSETHIKKLKIVCSICKYPCSTRQALRVHMKIKHWEQSTNSNRDGSEESNRETSLYIGEYRYFLYNVWFLSVWMNYNISF